MLGSLQLLCGFQRDLNLHRIGHIADNVALDKMNELRRCWLGTHECDLRSWLAVVESYHVLPSALHILWSVCFYLLYERHARFFTIIDDIKIEHDFGVMLYYMWCSRYCRYL